MAKKKKITGKSPHAHRVEWINKMQVYSYEGLPHSSVAKNVPAVQETRVQSLGGEDPLEEGVAAHSSIPAWRVPWTEQPGGLRSKGPQRAGHSGVTERIEAAYTHVMKYCRTVETKLERPAYIFKHAVLCRPLPHARLCRREGEPQEKPRLRTLWPCQRRAGGSGTGRRQANCICGSGFLYGHKSK